MKKVIFANPNKMLMESGHKTFDRQTNLISKGNVYSNTQISAYIRPFTQTEMDGRTVSKGQLQSYDLRTFGKLPYHIDKAVRAYSTNNKVILYMFFHRNSEGEKTVHGYVMTNEHHQLIDSYVTGPRTKSVNVIEECSQYIAA